MSRLDELLEVHIQVAVDLTAQARDVQQPDYPARALQQLIRNALIYRAYEGTNAPVRVYWQPSARISLRGRQRAGYR